MKHTEKVNYLKKNHLDVWYKTRCRTYDELSEQQTLFCCCGKLASSLHERRCRKFNNKVDRETTKKLEHLIQDKP